MAHFIQDCYKKVTALHLMRNWEDPIDQLANFLTKYKRILDAMWTLRMEESVSALLERHQTGARGQVARWQG